jgi:hypothetical protein
MNLKKANNMGDYFDKDGNEIDLLTWGRLFAKPEYKVIKQDELKNGKWISTVWLGMNHSFDGGKLIFETMTFSNRTDYAEIDCERYETLDEAIKGHEAMVKKHDK